MPDKPPIINCHTHIFTGNHVPPYIAKTFVPSPLYYLLHVQLLIRLFRFWYNSEYSPYRWIRKPLFKKIAGICLAIRSFINRIGVLYVLKLIVNFMIMAFAVLFTSQILELIMSPGESNSGVLAGYVMEWFCSFGTVESNGWFQNLMARLCDHGLFLDSGIMFKVIFILIVFLFFPSGRKAILFVIKRVWALPGKEMKEFLIRYWNIGRFAFYREQRRILKKLTDQYPEETGFIILPMDMEFMDAGKPKESYIKQMEQLAELKNNDAYGSIIYPFVFVDPRRLAIDPDYFSYTLDSNSRIMLNKCFIKEYIEEKGFSGFKIYPALGYYPFDERLLPVWKYAAQNEIPILTHCIRGTIFYRGKKKKEWEYHPIFKQDMGESHEPLQLPELKNSDFSVNFTHPLNYLCLLKERLLLEVVRNSSDPSIHALFGYQKTSDTLTSNLSHLKICFGHFGGDDQWKRYFESDRDNFSAHLLTHDDGIDFMRNSTDNKFSWAKLEQIWKDTDWYSIICSMMLQHPNVYSDISYIVHNPDILPLLNRTLMPENRVLTTGRFLRERVLFGTDFYVVRNHKSEKNMLADMLASLDSEEFDLIARTNPREFLMNVL